MTAMKAERLREFSSAASAADSVAHDIAAALEAGLRERDVAVFAASGGSTPRPVYQALSGIDLDWARIHVVLADERWVDPGEAGSNETFIRETLLHDRAASARLTGLKSAHDGPQAGADAINARLSALPRPFDAVVLGMGDDGHSLSWFPHAQGLDQALNAKGPLACAITAHASAVTGVHTQRMTLTRAALNGVRRADLLTSGASKRAALEAALAHGPVADMPVRALLQDQHLPLTISWWP
ncbi:6-phosphogluconolactonase [Alkalicaulis satelles]|uniref:6-phosphogluconolactonase n=1 Tax=Alkalicaulis satelles TaxID=2609175 RepID=A0A5M6ZDH9_9PROT|nr:6-phosphogluconolactonase [Alkalicaulis satelles]KAA5802270.1 6-phosphogluconolactonase [Alkalicaulis satelles]